MTAADTAAGTARGMFIAFEGGEGAGKSTQAVRLTEQLRSRGLVAHLTREPGATPAGAELRKLLLDREWLVTPPVAEALLFLADRNVHVEQVISPRLADGQVVVCDRYSLSTFVYQGLGRGLDLEFLSAANWWASNGLQPDLTILLDIDPQVGLVRAAQAGRLNRIDREPVEFHQRIRQGFLDLADTGRGLVVIDAAQDVDTVAAQVLHAVDRAAADIVCARPAEPGLTG